ncbi:MAG TPA: heparan-alpha-glucosaminide N-acetyltransferase domain-containing protein [Bryobacteraceae bacterium]|nr:heparan-alpha-glucosaminide N-acetyltransferase domain-containing protein [Bryobacteraceae bacterium]
MHFAVKDRLVSLDAFRGATMASMILVNNAGSWSAVYPPLLHAQWHGWTFTDLIFPSFLWIVGVAMTLSFARRVERGEDRRRLLLHAFRRALILFGIGLLLNGFPYYNPATIRIPGVLQRIAICYLVAAAIFLFTRVRGQIIWTVSLLAVYWLAMRLVPVPGYGAGSLEPVGNFAQYVDSQLLSGHMYRVTRLWDPEGVVSTLPSIATTLMGILAGHILRRGRTAAETAAWLFTMGAALLAAGSVMSLWMPINKNLWTTPFAVFMAGMSTTGFALCYWVADGAGKRRWTKPFVIFGMNAIAVYVLSGMVDRVMELIPVGSITLQRWIFLNIFAPLASEVNASLLYAVAYVALMFLVAWGMYRRKWFVKF